MRSALAQAIDFASGVQRRRPDILDCRPPADGDNLAS
jgi:hypothetical protein